MEIYKKAKKVVSEIEELEKLLVWFEDDPKSSMRMYDVVSNETRRINIDDMSKHILRRTINGRIETKIKELEEL